jgi:hypothetical protein
MLLCLLRGLLAALLVAAAHAWLGVLSLRR